MVVTRRKKAKIMAELPHELLFVEILPRLPAKSLGRFMSISRLWYSSIKNPEFIRMNMHLTRATKKLLVQSDSGCVNDISIIRFHTFDYEARTKGVTRRCDFPLKDMKMVWGLSSCNGIVCIAINSPRCQEFRFIELVLWNPLTGEYRMVQSRSGQNIHHRPEAWAFWYDSSVDDFKILTITPKSKAYMFNLKSNSWRAINEVGVVARIKESYVPQPGVFVGGKIYWGVVEPPVNNIVYGRSVLCFDLNNEKLTKMPLPVVENRLTNLDLTVHQECLNVFVSYSPSWQYPVKARELEVWRMNENMEQGWEKTTIISSKDNWKYDSRPICFTIHGEVLMRLIPKWKGRGRAKGNKIVAYNPEKHDIEHDFKIMDGIKKSSKAKLYIRKKVTYIETLVSPNYIGE